MLPVSSLITVYIGDDTSHFEQALESILSQTDAINEIVLVQNGPIDIAAAEIINRYKNLMNIKHIKLNENYGLAYALNIGLSYCSNDLVMRMDSDDISMPTRAQYQYAFMMDNPHVDVVGSHAIVINNEGKRISKKTPLIEIGFEEMIAECLIIHPSAMFRKSRINMVGGYDNALSKSQDWDLWLRLLLSGSVIMNIDVPLLKFRAGKGMVARRKLEQKFNRIIIRKHSNGLLRFKLLSKSYIIQLLPVFILYAILFIQRKGVKVD